MTTRNMTKRRNAKFDAIRDSKIVVIAPSDEAMQRNHAKMVMDFLKERGIRIKNGGDV